MKLDLFEMFGYQMKMGPPSWSQSASQANVFATREMGSQFDNRKLLREHGCYKPDTDVP
ncbi:unnamed protein product [Dovyalis caffra]|uniref:Uncharacterized protein n=1 Tax=Dovyalis caffra TaxID=77055 RepID=A0AAV1RJE5_9ROSI|nr:unnamed protein product [Dovyalis caffra]